MKYFLSYFCFAWPNILHTGQTTTPSKGMIKNKYSASRNFDLYKYPLHEIDPTLSLLNSIKLYRTTFGTQQT